MEKIVQTDMFNGLEVKHLEKDCSDCYFHPKVITENVQNKGKQAFFCTGRHRGTYREYWEGYSVQICKLKYLTLSKTYCYSFKRRFY